LERLIIKGLQFMPFVVDIGSLVFGEAVMMRVVGIGNLKASLLVLWKKSILAWISFGGAGHLWDQG